MNRLVAAAAVAGVLVAAPVRAQTAVFLVRHAERADAGQKSSSTMATDPDLSTEGRARAESLARLLKDAGITAIYTTEYQRTRATAAPLARALGIEPVVISSKEAASLHARLSASTGRVLVVGHSNTVPDVIKALGIKDPVTIGDDEFDNLFIVVRADAPTLVRLRYR